MTWAKGRPGVIVRQKHGYIIDRLALAQQIAHPLQVGRDVGHDYPPRVLFVENRGSVKTPSGIVDTLRCVRPSVADQLVDAFKKVPVGFGLHIEWCGAEDGRVQPGPGLG